jgi:ABC-2 type transport system ATP-binding protein
VRVETPDVGLASGVLEKLGMTVQPGSAEGADTQVVAVLGDTAAEPDVVVSALVRAKVRVRGFALENPSLEDRFVSLTGEGFNVDH